MTDLFERAARQVLGRERDDDDGVDHRRAPLRAPVTLAKCHWFEKRLPEFWDNPAFDIELAKRRRETKARKGVGSTS